MDYEAKCNYCSFGDVLRIFLNTPTTILEAHCFQAHFQLISLCDIQDGFLLLQTLLFNCSLQLTGKYSDFHQEIDNLDIVPGEHLSKIYQRTMQLSTEINLSGTTNGSSTEISYKFYPYYQLLVVLLFRVLLATTGSLLLNIIVILNILLPLYIFFKIRL